MRMRTQKNRTSLCSILLALAVLCLPFFRASAQVDVGSLTGTVRDTTGAVIPSAKIVLANDATGMAMTTKSTSTGTYVFNAVYTGTYTLTVMEQSFETFADHGIAIHIQDRLNVDAILAVGQQTQQITVTASSGQLQTQSPEVGMTMTGGEIDDLPLMGRDWTSLAQTAAGATTIRGGTPQSPSAGDRGAQIQGINNGEVDYRLNGISNNMEFWDAGASVIPPPDAITEAGYLLDSCCRKM